MQPTIPDPSTEPVEAPKPARARITPLLRYDDAEAAINWLCQAFGFYPHYLVRDDAERVVHAELRMGNELVMIGPVREADKYGMKSPRAVSAQSQSLCVALEDVDSHYAAAVGWGATILTPVYDTPYGAREYTCLDLEGHIWTFGSYWGYLDHECPVPLPSPVPSTGD